MFGFSSLVGLVFFCFISKQLPTLSVLTAKERLSRKDRPMMWFYLSMLL